VRIFLICTVCLLTAASPYFWLVLLGLALIPYDPKNWADDEPEKPVWLFYKEML